MPRKILSPGKTPFDGRIDDDAIKQVLNSLSPAVQLGNETSLTYNDKWALYKFLGRFSPDAGPITPGEARDMIRRFVSDQGAELCFNTFNFTRADFNTFMNKVQDLRAGFSLPTGYKYGYRIYVGYDISGYGGVVMVPMYGPAAVGGVIDRTLEKEKSFFQQQNKPFFSLLGYGTAVSAGVTTFSQNQGLCRTRITSVDMIGKQACYFTEDDFNEFLGSLHDPNFATMRINLAKTSARLLTTIVSFYDENGAIIPAGNADGWFFDQADLIPPPPNTYIVPDSFFVR